MRFFRRHQPVVPAIPSSVADLGNMPAAVAKAADVHVHVYLNGKEIAKHVALAVSDATAARP